MNQAVRTEKNRGEWSTMLLSEARRVIGSGGVSINQNGLVVAKSDVLTIRGGFSDFDELNLASDELSRALGTGIQWVEANGNYRFCQVEAPKNPAWTLPEG